MNGSKMNIKRTVSMLLVVLMLVTAMPVTVLAAEGSSDLKEPKVTIAYNDDNGGITYTIVERNARGVESYTVNAYTEGKTESVYKKTIDCDSSGTTSGKILISDGLVADKDCYITVELNAETGYTAPKATKSNTVKAVNRISSVKASMKSGTTNKLTFNEGAKLVLDDLQVVVDYYDSKVDDATYVYGTSDFRNNITVYLNDEELIWGSDNRIETKELNVKDHDNGVISVKFRSKKATLSTKVSVREYLSDISIDVKPDYIDGGIWYKITDDKNTSGSVSSYIVNFESGEVLYNKEVKSKEGYIRVEGNLVGGDEYYVKVRAVAKTSDYIDGDWSETKKVFVSEALKAVEIKNYPKMEYSSFEAFDASGLVVTFVYPTSKYNKCVIFSTEEGSEFKTFGITITPSHGTKLTKSSYDGKTFTVKVNGLTATSSEKFVITGKLSVPSIKLAPDYASGGLRYTITCADDSSVDHYNIILSNGNEYTVTTLTGNLALESKYGNLIVGTEYSAKVVAYASKDNVQSSDESDSSPLAKAVSKLTKFEIYSEPNKDNYKVGDTLDYTGLAVIISFANDAEYVPLSKFDEYGITVTPANGTKVTSTTKTVTVKLGNFTDTFEVTVGESNVASLKILSKPDKVSYNAGDKLDLTGLIIKITYTDGTNNTVEYDWADFITSGITTSPSNGTALKTTDEEVVVTCGGKSASFDITVKSSNKAVTKIEITKTPDKLVYDVDDKLDLEGLEITVTLKSGTKITGVEYDDFDDYGIEVDPTTKEKLAKTDTTVRVYYSSSVYDEFNITVGDADIKSLDIRSLPKKTTYVAGEAPDYAGLVVRAYFDSAKKVYTDVAYADFGKYNIKVVPDSDNVTKYQLTVEDTSVLVYYGTLNQTDNSKNIFVTFDITVKARTILSMEIYKQPTLVYQSGDKLDLSELAIKVYYSANKKDFDIVTYENFEAFGIKCTPDNATVLTAEYNGTKVKATAGTVYVETNALTVTSKAVKNITVTSLPTKLEYNAGEKLSLEGLKLELTYADGTKKSNITYDLFDNYGITSGYKNGMALSASHNGKYMKFTVKNSDGTEKSVTLSSALKVVERAITELKVLSYTDTYAAGDSFDTESLKILARYENGTTGYVATESIIVDPRASLAVTDTKVTLYYGTFTIELDVYVYDLDIYNVIKDWDGSRYTDVKKGQWFYPYMGYMSAIGAIDPVDDAGTKLGPDVNVTRAMFVEMLYRIEGSPKVNVTGRFVDIPRNASYIKAAEWAYSVGITTGTSETAFSPDKTVTREQMVTFLYRYAEYKGCKMNSTSSVKTYPDYAKITGYNNGKDSYGFAKSFEWAISEGIITGALNGGVITLNPLGTAMRSEASKILTIFHIKYIAE